MFDQSNLFNIIYIALPLFGIVILGGLIYMQRHH
ncbi:hypothetical protein GGE12_005706 [Rhizobium mongolense]|uniref:Uncharacterized protein n=1 Tax=Rhizobium mongolense TaxID=57676 RepID=A0A7W6WGV4_9HYPH|nr:hypothetical protein [Rhizobium mongolense]